MCKFQVANKTGRTQLDIYFDEPILDFDFLEQMDVLKIYFNSPNTSTILVIISERTTNLINTPYYSILGKGPTP